MVISNWLDAYHEGAVLDASAAAVVCAVARLVVYVIEDHPRRVLRAEGERRGEKVRDKVGEGERRGEKVREGVRGAVREEEAAKG